MAKPYMVVLTGAGMSAESGIRTFRDSNGLWEDHRIEDVASPEGWQRNAELVRSFYNARFLNMKEAHPNAGHITLAQLQDAYDVQIITQNVDDLHERAGSEKVLHLHGRLDTMCSTRNRALKAAYEHPLTKDSRAPDGGLWRPDIVWFGEEVPNYPIAYDMVANADLFVIIGTSLLVAPASFLAQASNPRARRFLIDPHWENSLEGFTILKTGAVEGTKMLVEKLELKE